jgi:hypothetical protein
VGQYQYADPGVDPPETNPAFNIPQLQGLEIFLSLERYLSYFLEQDISERASSPETH